MSKDEIIAIGKKICKWWKSIDDKHVIFIDEHVEWDGGKSISYSFVMLFYDHDTIKKIDKTGKHLIVGQNIMQFYYNMDNRSKSEIDSIFYEELAKNAIKYKNDKTFMALASNSFEELNVKLDLLVGLNEQEQEDVI